MKWTIMTIILLGPVTAFGAGREDAWYRASYYGYFAGGACQHSWAVVGGGGGAEGFLWQGLTLGIEGGYQSFTKNSYGFGELYLPVGYHFVNRNKPAKWDPFVSGTVVGLVAPRGGVGGAAYLGGGVTHWFKERVGVRMEFRVHAYAFDDTTAQARVGITLR